MPRQIVPGRTYLLTRRCTQRQFLLRPDAATNNAFVYCLAVAARRSRIAVHGFIASSNHYHAVVTDLQGRLPDFLEHFHKLVAKHQNALRGRWENMWSSAKTSVVWLVDDKDAVSKLVYTLTNPVKDQLVERTHQWPGATSYHATLNGKLLTAEKPSRFFRPNGPMEKQVSLQCMPLPGLVHQTRESYREMLLVLLEQVEESAATERRLRGSRVVGRKALLSQIPSDKPDSLESRRGLNPTVAAQGGWPKKEALDELRAFRSAYLAAREAWLVNKLHSFPFGTWWMAKHAGAMCEPGANSS